MHLPRCMATHNPTNTHPNYRRLEANTTPATNETEKGTNVPEQASTTRRHFIRVLSGPPGRPRKAWPPQHSRPLFGHRTAAAALAELGKPIIPPTRTQTSRRLKPTPRRPRRNPGTGQRDSWKGTKLPLFHSYVGTPAPLGLPGAPRRARSSKTDPRPENRRSGENPASHAGPCAGRVGLDHLGGGEPSSPGRSPHARPAALLPLPTITPPL